MFRSTHNTYETEGTMHDHGGGDLYLAGMMHGEFPNVWQDTTNQTPHAKFARAAAAVSFSLPWSPGNREYDDWQTHVDEQPGID